MQYFYGIHDALAKTEDEDERALIVENACSELRWKEATLATDERGSVLVQQLLQLAPDEEIRQFWWRLEGFLPHMASQRYASHVMQTLADRTASIVHQEAAAFDAGELPQGAGPVEADGTQAPPPACASVLRAWAELDEAWDDVAADLCGTHVLRSLLCLLAGTPVADTMARGPLPAAGGSKKAKRRRKQQRQRAAAAAAAAKESASAGDGPLDRPLRASSSTPRAFRAALKQTSDTVLASSAEGVRAMVVHPYASQVLQTLMRVLSAEAGPFDAGPETAAAVPGGRDACDAIVRLVLGVPGEGAAADGAEGDAEGELRRRVGHIAEHSAGSRWLEVALASASRDLVDRICRAVASPEQWADGGIARRLAMHGDGNFALQRLLASATDAEEVEALVASLRPLLGQLLACARHGVVTAVLRAAARSQTAQQKAAVAVVSAALAAGAGGDEGADEEEGAAAKARPSSGPELLRDRASVSRALCNLLFLPTQGVARAARTATADAPVEETHSLVGAACPLIGALLGLSDRISGRIAAACVRDRGSLSPLPPFLSRAALSPVISLAPPPSAAWPHSPVPRWRGWHARGRAVGTSWCVAAHLPCLARRA